MSVETDGYGVQDPYDEYFDSMTRGQQNKAMRPPTHDVVKINGQPVDISNASVAKERANQERGWLGTSIRFVAGWTIIILGALFEGIGIAYVWIGKRTQEWGKSLIV